MDFTDDSIDEFEQALTVLLDILRAAVVDKPDARRAMLSIASRLVEIADDVVPEPPAEMTRAITESPAEPTGPTRLRLADADAELVVPGSAEELTAANRAADEHSAMPASGDITPVADKVRQPPDLRLIVKRCRLKAECCRWAITRRRRLAEDAPFQTAVKPTDEDLLSRARSLPDCYAWTLNPYASLPSDNALESMSETYDNVAAIAGVASGLDSEDPISERFRDECYVLFAEAQSALRKSLTDAAEKWDRDQEDAFSWLHVRAFEDRVYVQRHMQLDDLADPVEWADLQSRIQGLQTRMDEHRRADQNRRNLFGKVRYKCQRMPDCDESELLAAWGSLSDTIEELIAAGLHPSDKDLRDLLLPIIETIPEAIQPGKRFAEVLRAIDVFIASREAEQETPTETAQPTQEVQQVADLLRGRVVLLIGGDQRRQAKKALERNFELAELRWLDTSPHQSYTRFKSEVAKPEVALVLLAIRWSSHSFGNVRTFCENHTKPLVRLPAGYGTNRVAVEIIKQAASDLGDGQTPLDSDT